MSVNQYSSIIFGTPPLLPRPGIKISADASWGENMKKKYR
jgi:hypothetical protein